MVTVKFVALSFTLAILALVFALLALSFASGHHVHVHRVSVSIHTQLRLAFTNDLTASTILT